MRTSRILFIILALILAVAMLLYGKRIYSFNIDSIAKVSMKDRENLSMTNWTMARALEFIKRFGEKIRTRDPVNGTSNNFCSIQLVGISKTKELWPAHALCDYRDIIRTKKSCLFYSFGIANKYDFDLELANKWKCQGVAFDPNIAHKSKLHPKITFHMIGARTLSDDIDRQWPLVSTVPQLQSCFGHTSIDILKMDCEGCEYALARDIEQYNINFFENISQFTVEFHVSKRWIQTPQHLINFGKLLYFLEKANLHLIHTIMSGCSSDHEALGCPQELLDVNYPCEIGKMCQNFLFAKDMSKSI